MTVHRLMLASIALTMMSVSPLPVSAAPQSDQAFTQLAQWDRNRDDRRDDRRYDNRGNNYNNNTMAPRNGIYRAGDVVPGHILGQAPIIHDWEERGLLRAPGGHNWVRVGQQFLLVRFSDQKIARILSYY